MKPLLYLVVLPVTLMLCILLIAVIPRDEWGKLNDSLPPP